MNHPAEIAAEAIDLFLEELNRRRIYITGENLVEDARATAAKAKAATVNKVFKDTDPDWAETGVEILIVWEPGDDPATTARMVTKALALRFAKGEILEGLVPVTHVGEWQISPNQTIRKIQG
jgi:hypothetical protein